MTTVDEIALLATPSSARRWPWQLLRVVTVLTTLSAFTQAVLAGGVAAGRNEPMPLDSANGMVLALGTLALFAALVLSWRPGGAPAWALLAGLAIVAATLVQLGLGFPRSLAVHVPLGTTVILAQGMLLVWVWRRPLPEPSR